MKKLLCFIICAALFACKSAVKIPEGAPEKIKIKTLLKNIEEAENDFTSIGIRLNGNFKNPSTNQGFKATINLLPDSLIWIDVADPILGLKVARAVIYRDSVAFINRLQKEYYTGSLSVLRQKLKIDFGFDLLQNILSANIAFNLNDDYILTYLPNFYLLSDHKVDGEGKPLPGFGLAQLHQLTINPLNFKATIQSLEESEKDEKYELHYINLHPRDGYSYPEKIILKVMQEGNTTVELDIKDVKFNENLNYSFTIPSGYVQMR